MNKLLDLNFPVDFADFCEHGRYDRAFRPGNDIDIRWRTRIEPMHLYQQGERGAEIYLKQYGKTIKAPKCIKLARLAELQGHQDFAEGFWKKAYKLEHPMVNVPGAVYSIDPQAAARAIDVFPMEMLPGGITLTQPYAIFATNSRVWVQKGSELNDTFNLHVEKDMRVVTQSLGAFVVEGDFIPDANTARLQFHATNCRWQEGWGEVSQPTMQRAGAEMIVEFLTTENPSGYRMGVAQEATV